MELGGQVSQFISYTSLLCDNIILVFGLGVIRFPIKSLDLSHFCRNFEKKTAKKLKQFYK